MIKLPFEFPEEPDPRAILPSAGFVKVVGSHSSTGNLFYVKFGADPDPEAEHLIWVSYVLLDGDHSSKYNFLTDGEKFVRYIDCSAKKGDSIRTFPWIAEMHITRKQVREALERYLNPQEIKWTASQERDYRTQGHMP